MLEQDRRETRAGRVVGAAASGRCALGKLLDRIGRIRRNKLAHAVRSRNAFLDLQRAVHTPKEAFVERFFAHETRPARRLLGELCTLCVQSVQSHRILAVVRKRVLRVLKMARQLRLHTRRKRPRVDHGATQSDAFVTCRHASPTERVRVAVARRAL